MDIIGRSYMMITSDNERVNWLSKQGNLTIKREREREREREGGKEEVHIQAGEAIIIQNVCRY